MANPTAFIKTATSVMAASAALLTALKENPQLAESAKNAVEKLKRATNSENPWLRFEAKLAAIEACADAVEREFPAAAEVDAWRKASAALRVRGELIWRAETGRRRRNAMKSLNLETTDLLHEINARLSDLTPGAVPEVEARTKPTWQ